MNKTVSNALAILFLLFSVLCITNEAWTACDGADMTSSSSCMYGSGFGTVGGNLSGSSYNITGSNMYSFIVVLTDNNVSSCTYALSSSSQAVGSSSGTGTATVTATPSGCSGTWTATSNTSWLTITSGTSGTGNGTVNYSYTANTTTDSRPGTLTIGGQPLTVVQSGLGKFLLTATKSGTGSGTVTSAPTGIDCGTTCSSNYNQNTEVTLTAAPSSSSTFASWSGGGCSGTGTCKVTITADTTVTATFTLTKKVKLKPQVLMAGFDPIILDMSSTSVKVMALVREGVEPIRNVSITDNTGALVTAMTLKGSLSNGDLLYETEVTLTREMELPDSMPDLFGSKYGYFLIKAVDKASNKHSFPTLNYGSNTELDPTNEPTTATLYSRKGCKRGQPQVLMAGLDPAFLDYTDTSIKIVAIVRKGSSDIQDVSLKNSGGISVAMTYKETLGNGDLLYEKEMTFDRGAFGSDEKALLEDMWGSHEAQYQVEVRDKAQQTHKFPNLMRGDYPTINKSDCWADQ